jgi:endoglucanase
VIDAIRAVDPDNLILVGSPHWDQDIHLVAAAPLTGYTNIAYTVHFYAATHKDELRARTQAAIDTGLPVFLSECAAMEASGDGPLDYASWNEWEQLADRNGLSWVAWSLSEKDETCSMIRDGNVPANGGWKDGDLKEWGRFVRDRLRAGAGLQ